MRPRALASVGTDVTICPGCGYSKARCDAIKPPAIKCCPDCKHDDGEDVGFEPHEITDPEPPRPEAVESGPTCRHRRKAYIVDRYLCRDCGAEVEPTEEPKPEPQPDAPLPFPWRLEFDGTLWSVMSADDQHVADDLREADARRIVERCNPAESPPSGEDEHEAALRELIDSAENGPHKRLEAALAHARRLLGLPD